MEVHKVTASFEEQRTNVDMEKRKLLTAVLDALVNKVQETCTRTLQLTLRNNCAYSLSQKSIGRQLKVGRVLCSRFYFNDSRTFATVSSLFTY